MKETIIANLESQKIIEESKAKAYRLAGPSFMELASVHESTAMFLNSEIKALKDKSGTGFTSWK